MQSIEYNKIQKEFLKRGFEVIKRYKRAYIVRNKHQEIAIAVLNPTDKKKAICVPLVFAHPSDKKVYPLKYNQVLHTSINCDREYRDLIQLYEKRTQTKA